MLKGEAITSRRKPYFTWKIQHSQTASAGVIALWRRKQNTEPQMKSATQAGVRERERHGGSERLPGATDEITKRGDIWAVRADAACVHR